MINYRGQTHEATPYTAGVFCRREDGVEGKIHEVNFQICGVLVLRECGDPLHEAVMNLYSISEFFDGHTVELSACSMNFASQEYHNILVDELDRLNIRHNLVKY